MRTPDCRAARADPYSFEPSEMARQAEAEKKNFKAEDMIPIIRKRTGPSGMSPYLEGILCPS